MASYNLERNNIINSPNFYENIQDEIELDTARLKKNVTIVKSLRLTAAELEVETAALFHAELWHDIEALKAATEKMDVDVLNSSECQ